MVIKWFWEILSELFQNELSNLLFFATSSSRVTLGGFIELEKTNGKLCRFKLEYAPYVKNRKNSFNLILILIGFICLVI